MPLEIGQPIPLGGTVYSVGVSARSSAGRLLATGTVVVDTADSDGSDPIRAARQAAQAMVDADPSLLMRVTVTPAGTHHVTTADGKPVPWNGDGFLDPPDDKEPVGPKRILSPDSPETGQ